MSRLIVLSDNGSLMFREDLANGTSAVSLTAPASLVDDVDLTLPSALPGSTSYLTLSSTGVISTAAAGSADVVVESAEVSMSGTPAVDNDVVIAHGLAYTPVASQIAVTCYRSSGSNDFGIRGMWIMAIDATNITVKLYVTANAASTYAKVVCRIHPA